MAENKTQLGLTRDELHREMVMSWNKASVRFDEVKQGFVGDGQDVATATFHAFLDGAYKATVDLIEANNRRLEEQLEQLGVLPGTNGE